MSLFYLTAALLYTLRGVYHVADRRRAFMKHSVDNRGLSRGIISLKAEVTDMDNREQLRRITELTEQIAGLPKGYLSKKTIGGKVYYYHQWSENGVK